MAHLSDEQMVAFLDGEAERGAVAQERAHLETCWQCRARMHDIEGSVRTFVDAREMLRPEADQLQPAPVEQFRQRLLRHAAISESLAPASLGDAILRWAGQVRMFVGAHRRAALAMLAATAVFVVTFSDLLNTTASAESILAHAQAFESQRKPGREQVEREMVRVQSVDRRSHAVRQLGDISWVEDGVSHLAEVKATVSASAKEEGRVVRDDSEAGVWIAKWMRQSGMAQPIGNYLAAQQWRAEVSVPAFRKLIAARGATGNSVEKVDGLYTLHYAFAQNHVSGIAEAMLSVRTSDYEPVRVSIVTNDAAGDTEYRFDRIAITIAPRTPELARLFDEANHASTAPAKESGLEPALVHAVPVSYLATPPAAVEIAAIVALHKVDACLGEEVNVFPMSDGSVMVQGLVDRPERRDAIRRALSSVNGPLTVHIFTPGEVRRASDLYTPPDQIVERGVGVHRVPTMTLADLSSEQMPLYPQLIIHFSAEGRTREEAQAQLAAFSNELVSSARQTLLHAWSLKRLEHEFPVERLGNLSPDEAATLDKIRLDHRRWIAILSRRQREMLTQIGVEKSAGTPLPSEAGSDLILQTAETENSLIRSLFTVNTESEDTSNSLSRLMSLLEQLGG